MLMKNVVKLRRCMLAVAAAGIAMNAMAARDEMGTGVPDFGLYSQATTVATIVWSLRDATTPFPAGCTAIVLSPATMGMDAYKLAAGTLVAARLSNKKIRFYAHADRGCEADYVQIMD